MEPRPISIIKRSYSAPAPVVVAAPTPPVPPPPPPPPDLIMPKPILTLDKKVAKPQPGYSVTPEEIQKRLHSLKKVSPEGEEEESQNGSPSDLVDLMRKVMVQRRETGWCDSSSQSSGCLSRNGGKLATVNSSWDDL